MITLNESLTISDEVNKEQFFKTEKKVRYSFTATELWTHLSS